MLSLFPKPRIKIDDIPLDEELSDDELKGIFGGANPLSANPSAEELTDQDDSPNPPQLDERD